MGARGPSPPPLLPARGLRARLGRGGSRPRPGPRLPGGSRGGLLGGRPPVSPSPPPPPHALGAGCRSGGGGLVNVRPALGPRAPRARWGPPSGCRSPPRGGFPLWASRGSPLAPLLHTLGACYWVGVPPLPSPPLRPLELGTCDRSWGGISSVSSSAWSVSSRTLLGVSSPPSSPCVFSLAGAGPALTVPPNDAAGDAPMVCAVGCPEPLSLSSLVGAGAAVTGTPTTAAEAAPMGCTFGCPVTPARSSVPISASTSCCPVAPLCARHLRHRVVTPWWVGRWVGFRPLPPARVRPPPVRIGTLWGLTGFRLPQGPLPLWDLSHPMTTRLPVRLCVESIHGNSFRDP